MILWICAIPHTCVVRAEIVSSTLENSWLSSPVTEQSHVPWACNPIPRLILTGNVCTCTQETRVRTFSEVLLTKQTLEASKCTTTGTWINNCDILTQRSELQWLVAILIDFSNLIFSENVWWPSFKKMAKIKNLLKNTHRCKKTHQKGKQGYDKYGIKDNG